MARGFRNGLIQTYSFLITVLFWGIIFFLTFLAAISSCAISCDAAEHTFFLSDSIWTNLLTVLLGAVLCLLLRGLARRCGFAVRLAEDGYFRRCRRILLVLLGILALVWVLATQFDLFGDPQSVQRAAAALLNGNPKPFKKGGYISIYPFQMGLAWLSLPLAAVFGRMNPLVFQLLNVLGVVLLYREFSECCALFGMSRGVQLGVVLLGILFYPFWLYCCFVYGNVLGMAFSVLAMRLELRFLRDGGLKRAFGSAGAACLAMLLKSNYLIFAIGMLLTALVELLRRFNWQRCLLPLLLIGAMLFQSRVPVALAEKVTCYRLDHGMNTWAWIVMGVRESDRAPGWYSDYAWTSLKEAGFDGNLQGEEARQTALAELKYYAAQKREGLDFFTRKTASQWNNPTFQGYWVAQTRPSRIKLPDWVKGFLGRRAVASASVWLNALQILILAGTLLWLAMCRREQRQASLCFAVTFIGGFVFHLFWEAKCQYVLSYFVLLLPLAAGGWAELARLLGGLLSRKERKSEKRSLLKRSLGRIAPFAAMSLVLCGLIWALYANGNNSSLRCDDAAYASYLAEPDAVDYLEN